MKKMLITAILLLLLTGCHDRTDQATVERWIAQAKINAADYVKNKYDFDAEIIGANTDKRGMWIGWESLDHVYVTMEHEGQKFTVYIDGAAPCMVGCDSYQAKEIKIALESEMETMLHAPVIVDADFGSPTEQTREDNVLFSAKYDGNNLPEVLAERLSWVTVYSTGADLSDAALDGKVCSLIGEKARATLIELRGELSANSQGRLSNEPVYCSAVREIMKDTAEYTAYGMASDEVSGLVWCWKDSGQPAPNVKVTSTASYHTNQFQRELSPLTPAYEVIVDTDEKLWFYYPVEKRDAALVEKHLTGTEYAAFFYTENAKTTYRQYATTEKGEYVCVNAPNKTDGHFTFYLGYEPKSTKPNT